MGKTNFFLSTLLSALGQF
jgi:hypothetical protein